LHDTVLKTLQGLSLEARALKSQTEATAPSVKETAAYIEEVCASTSREIREVIFDLRSEEDTAGISSQLAKILEAWRENTGISGDFSLSGEDMILPPEPVRQLRNIVAEALTNIQHHAGASRVQINMNISHETLNIEISDNGRGIGRSLDELHPFVVEGKLGIAGMKERVELLGGNFSLSSGESGTCLSFGVPVSP
jgi:signal transduction histidine kinase